MSSRPPFGRLLYLSCGLSLLVAAPGLLAQEPVAGAAITGRVLDAATAEPVAGVRVQVEGTGLVSLSDSTGTYRFRAVPPGPQMLRAERLGYADARVPVTVPARGLVVHDLRMAATALELEGVTVTADMMGRARGELGTASVIGQDAIRHQTATSLAGILELIPGVQLQPPGLDGVQQIALRGVPVSSGGSANLGMTSAGDLASFGTLIILDGVPLSNNANLQTLGPRGELSISTSAGGGIDLRRVPAAMIERVEVIRGVPSARYGDLTQGTIVVDTRAGAFDPELLARFDARTGEFAVVGGRGIGTAHTGTVTLDVARTKVLGVRDDETYRVATQFAHRASLGRVAPGGEERLLLDTRVDLFRMLDDLPEQPDIQPGVASSLRETALRLSHRGRLALGETSRLELTASFERGSQSTFRQGPRLRAAMPFTRRLTEGRETGHFVGGQYISVLHVDGEPRQFYGRLEAAAAGGWLGATHSLRAGVEARREWNPGAGYQFDLERPPQVTFNGVNGFDRPRRFDEVAPVANTAFYLDDRVTAVLPADVLLEVQAGVRLDMLHRGTHWFSGSRDVVVQPRLTTQLSPLPWLRLRAGAGRTTKLPSLGQLYPAPQYYDVVNVNWFANDPAERLAVLTTYILDPTNPELGFVRTDKGEAGLEATFGSGFGLALVGFRDRMSGGVGLRREPAALLREHFALSDSTQGTGRPPTIIEPAASADTVPVLIDRPANNLTLDVRGIELTAMLPEIRLLRTRLEVQGAWISNRLERDAIEFRRFSDFQLQPLQPRAPYWEGATSTGRRAMLNYRLIHHQPAVGLVVTGTIQHVVREVRQDLGATDTLAFAGYITRDGQLVPVAAEERTRPEFSDLRQPRSGLSDEAREVPADWLFSLQVSKTLPLDGRLAFYAFNAFDRTGRFGEPGVPSRIHPPMRFGLELTMPAGSLLPWL
jgi:outer membrane receptor protein involved in Fe transport